MSKTTAVGAGALSRTENVAAVVVPAPPSTTVTSSIVRTGSLLQEMVAENVFRGAGAPGDAGDAAEKSAPFWSVSVHPLPSRNAAAVAEIVGAAAAPSKKLALPYPTRSTIDASAAAEHGLDPPLHPSEPLVLTRATLPAPAAIAIGVGSIRSAAGNGTPVVPPACCTRKYWPGLSVTDGNSVFCVSFAPKAPVPVALAYCSDQPASDTGTSPLLNSSMKSCVNVAFAFPPPP
jgi:hypothetical protein